MVVVNIQTASQGKGMIRGFTRFEKQLKDLREPFKAIVADFYKVEENIFRSEGTPISFRSLDKKYEKWKKKHFPGQTIMRLRDNLYNALTGGRPSDSSKAKADIKISKQQLYLGVISPYFIVQEKRGRQAIQLTNEIKDRWATIIHEWAYNKFKEEVLD